MRSDQKLELDPRVPLDEQFDIERTQNFSYSGKERNHYFANLGNGKFLDISGVSGLDDLADGRKWALIDLDRDGWQDIATVNANSPKFRLYRNRIGDRVAGVESSGMMALKLVGGNWSSQPNPSMSCRNGYGAKIRLYLGERELLREFRCGEGFAAQNSATMIVGIGSTEGVDRLVVEWPSGKEQSLESVSAGQLITVYEDSGHSPTGENFVLEPYQVAMPVPSLASAATANTVQASIPVGINNRSSAKLAMYTTMATWCPKCKGELPQIKTLRTVFAPEQLAMLAVPTDPRDDREKLERYVDEYQPSYELLLDLTRRDIESVRAMAAAGTGAEDPLPATLVTDSRGHVLLVQAGVPTISAIKKLLAGSLP